MKSISPHTTLGPKDTEVENSLGRRNGEFMPAEPALAQESPEAAIRRQSVANFRLLWESRRFLVKVTGAGLLLSTLIAFVIPRHFQSSARLMPPDNQSGSGLGMFVAALSGGTSGGLGAMASDLLGINSTSDLLVGVLQSRSVQDRLIDKFDLRHVYGTRWRESARKRLAAWTDIVVDRKSQIVTIKVTDERPEQAQAIAQAYVDELNRTLAEVSTSSARRERIFLEGRLRTVSQDLELAEKEFSQFASKNSTIDIKEQGKAMVEAAAILQGQLIAARSELEGLKQIFSEKNVRVRSLQARVNELESQLRKVGGSDADLPGQSAAQGDSLYPSIRQLPLLGVPYADLYRKTAVQEAIFETLTKQYELARVQEAKEIATVKVLDQADLPERKTFPPRLLLMALGTMLSLSLGIAWNFGGVRWNQIDPADPSKALALEVFATVRAAVPWASRNGHGGRGNSAENDHPEITNKKAGD